MTTTATIPSHVHQSKWGFHPCDRETFLKLKELNKVFIQAQHQKAAYERWARKLPKNRVVRPKLRDSSGNPVGYGAPVPRPEPPLNALLKKDGETVKWVEGANLIGEVYRTARYPQPTHLGVKQLKLSVEAINRLLEK